MLKPSDGSAPLATPNDDGCSIGFVVSAIHADYEMQAFPDVQHVHE